MFTVGAVRKNVEQLVLIAGGLKCKRGVRLRPLPAPATEAESKFV